MVAAMVVLLPLELLQKEHVARAQLFKFVEAHVQRNWCRNPACARRCDEHGGGFWTPNMLWTSRPRDEPRNATIVVSFSRHASLCI
jgi:hypothetical protein